MTMMMMFRRFIVPLGVGLSSGNTVFSASVTPSQVLEVGLILIFELPWALDM